VLHAQRFVVARSVDAGVDRRVDDATAGEVELLAEQEGIPQAVARLESLAATLGCTTPERRSYLELLLGDERHTS
jgi:hypothetical protein